MVEFAPAERHAVLARSTARLLQLLTSWPGDDHRGTMSLSDKAAVGSSPVVPSTVFV